jgi:hypothetical protein
MTQEPCLKSAVQRILCLLFFAIPLSGCASASSNQKPSGTVREVSARYVAREWAGHNDGRVYGGVVNSPSVLSGVLGTYRGCLVEVRSQTLIVLSGAMEFHLSDGHAAKEHIFSKTLLGDGPATTITLGSTFTVAGLKAKSLPSYIRLDQNIPEKCAKLGLFFTETETLKPN